MRNTNRSLNTDGLLLNARDAALLIEDYRHHHAPHPIPEYRLRRWVEEAKGRAAFSDISSAYRQEHADDLGILKVFEQAYLQIVGHPCPKA